MTDAAARYVLHDFELQCKAVLPKAELVYRTHGTLASDRSNVVLYPTSYGAQHTDIEWLVGPGGILDASRWFVVIANMFGNGLSSSPSNCQVCGLAEDGFTFTHFDNVRAQERMLRAVFGVERLALVYGWSMGAQQAYYWGALFPERVERIAALCGTARTSEHNRIFLLSLRAALTADPAWNGRRFEAIPERGLRAFARIYASWAASQAFYREGIYRKLGYDSLEDYLLRGWEANYRKRDPHDLIAMIDTWLACDVGNTPLYQGNTGQALAAIQARTLVMPASTDLYFTPEDCATEAALIPGAEVRLIPSIWGHRAGNPAQNPEDAAFIRAAVHALLAQPSKPR
jgi:homoserine O-acetyltransferase